MKLYIVADADAVLHVGIVYESDPMAVVSFLESEETLPQCKTSLMEIQCDENAFLCHAA